MLCAGLWTTWPTAQNIHTTHVRRHITDYEVLKMLTLPIPGKLSAIVAVLIASFMLGLLGTPAVRAQLAAAPVYAAEVGQ